MTDEPVIEPIYTLRGNATQMQTIRRAMELYARIGIGQLEEILQHASLRRIQADRSRDKTREFIVARRLLDFVNVELFDSNMQAIGSEALPDDVRIAWDIMAVIRYQLELDRATVSNFSTVHPISAQPLPTITKVEREPDIYYMTEIVIVAGTGGTDMIAIIPAWNPGIEVNLTSILQRSPPIDSLKPGDTLRPGTRIKGKVNLAAGTSYLRLYDIKYTADLYDDEEIAWATGLAEVFLTEHNGETSMIAVGAIRQNLIDCYRYGPMAEHDIETLATLLVENWLPLLSGEVREVTIDDLVETMCLAIRNGVIKRGG